MSKLVQYAKLYKRVVAWSEEDNAWIVRVPEIHGCVTHGDTMSEAMKNADEAIKLNLESMEELGEEIPVPSALAGVEKKFLLRIDGNLFSQIETDADASGLSMNEYIKKSMREGGKSRTVVHASTEAKIASSRSVRMPASSALRAAASRVKSSRKPMRSTKKRVTK